MACKTKIDCDKHIIMAADIILNITSVLKFERIMLSNATGDNFLTLNKTE